jgi:hypothetical protein
MEREKERVREREREMKIFYLRSSLKDFNSRQ